MKFSLATIYVNDMEKSLKFYHEILGLPIVKRQPVGAGKELVFLGEAGEANVELIPVDDKMTYSGFSIGFEVDNLEEMKARLAENGYSIKREITPGGSAVLCFLDGPNGEEVELVYSFGG